MKKTLVVMFILLAVLPFVTADIAPEPGLKRISVNNVITNINDFPEYTFFIGPDAQGPGSLGVATCPLKIIESDGIVPIDLRSTSYCWTIVYAVKKSEISDRELTSMNVTQQESFLMSSSVGRILTDLYYSDVVPESSAQTERTLNHRIDASKLPGGGQCAAAGEYTITNPPRDDKKVCCSGLIEMPTGSYEESTCVFAPGGAMICSDCGNGVCESWESKCGCPKDCSALAKSCPQGSSDEAGKCMHSFSNGRKAEIKVMPETASERARERLGELGFNIELKEVGNKVVYQAEAEKQGKMLGLFKTKAKVSVQIDADTGEIVREKKPWWAFLATGI